MIQIYLLLLLIVLLLLQADYRNLINIAAELVDSLESTVRGKTVCSFEKLSFSFASDCCLATSLMLTKYQFNFLSFLVLL